MIQWLLLVPEKNLTSGDLALLQQTAREAGQIARRYFDTAKVKSWTKDNNHPVTEADIAVNDFLAKTLLQARPDYGWLSEETKDDASRHTAPLSFVVDPIDGTRAFIDGLPHFTICLAVVKKGQGLAGVVYNPITDEMYTAAKGEGAFLNGAKIKVSACARVENCSIIGYVRKFKRLGWPDMRVSMRNSMALRIAMVAAGQRDATVAFTPKSDWDLAAATVIATEAGAKITDLAGNAFNFASESVCNEGVICASPNLHALLLEQVKAAHPHVGHKILETHMSDRNPNHQTPEQLLHIVIGGELVDPNRTEFVDLAKIEYIGAYPNYASAHKAWKNAAQRTVDNAHMRFFILHAHHLIDPDNDGIIG